jgi:hypothetical protein
LEDVQGTTLVQRIVLRSSFGSSTLVRLLGDWTPAQVEPSGLDVAERLSLWVNAFDAIRLQAAHQSVANLRAAKPAQARKARAPALADDVQRVRSVLAKAIAQEPGPVVETGHTPADLRRLARGAAKPDAAEDGSYARWRQRHLELQRQMDLMIPPLRDHVRNVLAAQASPRLRQLAALDAAMEQVLAAREQQLLPTVAEHMERRFAQLLAAHRQALADGGQQDDPASWRRPGGWLEQFAREWRQLLAAELDVRLQPVTGLVDALSKELDEQQ